MDGDLPSLDECTRPEDAAVLRLVVAARRAALVLRAVSEGSDLELLEAIEGVEAFFESDDPIQNGWVGSDGRP